MMSIPRNTFSEESFFRTFLKFSIKLRTLTPKIWLFLSKLFFTCPKEPTSGKKKFFLKNLYISIVRGLWAEIEQKLSEKKIQQSCQKCIMGERMDIFRLIALLDFVFFLKVYRLSAKVFRAFVRKKSASCQI